MYEQSHMSNHTQGKSYPDLDRVLDRNDPPAGHSVTVLSGSEMPDEIISSAKMLALVFTSDGSVTRQGAAD
jgi:hypothetical protein